jgi:DNA-binding transcriptional MerR regulator
VDKAPEAFRTISEVAQELDVPQHVLRFWESRFREIKPMKRGGGRRYYRPNDLDLLRGIRHLLYSEGYTIRGVQRLLREQGPRFVQSVWQPGAPRLAPQPADDEAATETLDETAGAGELPLSSPRGADKGERPERIELVEPVAPRMPPAHPAGLARDDVQKLEAALRELAECRRLLEAALAERGDDDGARRETR